MLDVIHEKQETVGPDKVLRVGDRILSFADSWQKKIGLEKVHGIGARIIGMAEIEKDNLELSRAYNTVVSKIGDTYSQIKFRQKTLEGLNPERVLKQGYAIMSGKAKVGEAIKILTYQQEIEAKINKVNKRKE